MIRKSLKHIVPILLAVGLLLTACIPALAAEPDLTREGSITLTLTDKATDKPIAGGKFALYSVGKPDGSGFAYTPLFDGCGIPLDKIDDPTVAERLAAYASEKKLTGTEKTAGQDGRAEWDALECGLYLVVQTAPTEGYYAASPFLASVPMRNAEGTGWIYDVDASPKVETLPESTPVPPTPPPSKPPKPPLIQTGQLNWPVPLLAAAGTLLFAVGWALTFIKRKKKHEK